MNVVGFSAGISYAVRVNNRPQVKTVSFGADDEEDYQSLSGEFESNTVMGSVDWTKATALRKAKELAAANNVVQEALLEGPVYGVVSCVSQTPGHLNVMYFKEANEVPGDSNWAGFIKNATFTLPKKR